MPNADYSEITELLEAITSMGLEYKKVSESAAHARAEYENLDVLMKTYFAQSFQRCSSTKIGAKEIEAYSDPQYIQKIHELAAMRLLYYKKAAEERSLKNSIETARAALSIQQSLLKFS